MNFEKYLDLMGLKPKFFQGIVEDNEDPLFRGRVRVRVLGLHTEVKSETKTEGIKTDHLPWAERLGTGYGSSMTSQGVFGGSPLKGSLVIVFYMDGKQLQKPYYIGTLAGNPKKSPTGKVGFEDPDALYPRKDMIDIHDVPFHIDYRRIGYSDNESYLTVRSSLPTDKYDNTQEIKSANGVIWGESSSSGGKPEARYNLTYESHSRDYTKTGDSVEDLLSRHGHVIEVDSTPLYERITLNHRVGSYIEMLASGDVHTKARGAFESVILGDKKVYTRGNEFITVDGNEYMLIGGEAYEEFKANLIQDIAEEIKQTIGTKKTVTVPTVVHECDKHYLDSASDPRKVNNFLICPMMGVSHSTQNKVFITV